MQIALNEMLKKAKINTGKAFALPVFIINVIASA